MNSRTQPKILVIDSREGWLTLILGELLDVFSQYSDGELRRVLDRCHLLQAVGELGKITKEEIVVFSFGFWILDQQEN